MVIDGIEIDPRILKKKFACNVSVCKGACCLIPGDGAPVLESEVSEIKKDYDSIVEYLEPEGIEFIEENGFAQKFQDGDSGYLGTPIMENGRCAYLVTNEIGISYCGIESAHFDGATEFRKPISCHLYPVTEDGNKLLFGEDHIECASACAKGEAQGIRLVDFLKESITRRFGEEFWRKLSEA